MNASFFRFFFLFLLLSFLAGAQKITPAPNQQPSFPPAKSNAALSYKITGVLNHTYGYDIYNAGKLMIHQPSVPGMPGKEGFKTKADAEKVAQLVITKIKKGEMPPSVTVAELKALKVIPL